MSLHSGNSSNIAFIDSACPTTVAEEGCLKNYIQRLPTGKSVELLDCEKMYKVIGGERRRSEGIAKLPCILGDKLSSNINCLRGYTSSEREQDIPEGLYAEHG